MKQSSSAGDLWISVRCDRYQTSLASARPRRYATESGARPDSLAVCASVTMTAADMSTSITALQVLRIGSRDHAVVPSHGDEVARLPALSEPRIGVRDGDLVETRHQLAHLAGVRRAVFTRRMGDRGLDEGIHGGGLPQTMGVLEGVDPHVELERGPHLGPPFRRRPVQTHARLLGAPARRERLGADDEHDRS